MGTGIVFRGEVIRLEAEVQPTVNKQFDLLAEHLLDKQMDRYTVYLCSTNDMQLQRLRDIFSDKGMRLILCPWKGRFMRDLVMPRSRCVFIRNTRFSIVTKNTV